MTAGAGPRTVGGIGSAPTQRSARLARDVNSSRAHSGAPTQASFKCDDFESIEFMDPLADVGPCSRDIGQLPLSEVRDQRR